jgi:hypothetical protein
LKQRKSPLGYASLPSCSLGERRIDPNQTLPMSLCLRRVIIACDRGHPDPCALRVPDWSVSHACTLQAMRTQGFPQEVTPL